MSIDDEDFFKSNEKIRKEYINWLNGIYNEIKEKH